MTEKQFVIQNLSQLLQAKAPKGVLILEGDAIKYWNGDIPLEGTTMETWRKVLEYVRGTCDKLEIPHFSLRKDFQRIKGIENPELKSATEDWIREKADLGLYVAGCLCCVENRVSYFTDSKQLERLFGVDRIFVASNQSIPNYPRGRNPYDPETHSYIGRNTIPTGGYFLV